jgi:hypothetical protein
MASSASTRSAGTATRRSRSPPSGTRHASAHLDRRDPRLLRARHPNDDQNVLRAEEWRGRLLLGVYNAVAENAGRSKLTWLMMSTIGSVHPAIPRGELDDPSFMMLNLGRMTPLGSLIGRVVYGLVLGIAYDAWPLS